MSAKEAAMTSSMKWRMGTWSALLVSLSMHVGLASAQDTSAVRVTTPLMEGWRFIQSDTLSDEEALASDGGGWQTIPGTPRTPRVWRRRIT